jgi:sodium/potassium-transporting ATPase subunit alpha
LVKGVSVPTIQNLYFTLIRTLQAPDILIQRCTSFLDANGTISPLDDDASASIVATQEDFSSRGQRVLLVAKKILTSKEIEKENMTDFTDLENYLPVLISDLVVVGLVALVDPPRHDTSETVRICRTAGIRFIMVTGEYLCSNVHQQTAHRVSRYR